VALVRGAGHDADMADTPTVLRSWTGWIRTTDRAAYAEYLDRTGMAAYRETPGNHGAWALMRDLPDGRTEVRTISLWEDRASIRAFAGEQIDRAVFYPDDDRFLIARDTHVEHFDVV
jgi:heme-degrading monooxygenase HmoA